MDRKLQSKIELNDIPENIRLFFDKHTMLTVHTLCWEQECWEPFCSAKHTPEWHRHCGSVYNPTFIWGIRRQLQICLEESSKAIFLGSALLLSSHKPLSPAWITSTSSLPTASSYTEGGRRERHASLVFLYSLPWLLWMALRVQNDINIQV